MAPYRPTQHQQLETIPGDQMYMRTKLAIAFAGVNILHWLWHIVAAAGLLVWLTGCDNKITTAHHNQLIAMCRNNGGLVIGYHNPMAPSYKAHCNDGSEIYLHESNIPEGK